MPLVAPVPAVWPTGLWNGQSLTEAPETTWCAVKVQPRCEKRVAAQLREMSLGYLLCARTEQRVYQRRRVTAQSLLFPGYVFACGHEDQLASLWREPRISTVLIPPCRQTLRRELEQLCRLIDSQEILTPEERLQPGDRARIIQGPFMGFEGEVSENRDSLRLFVGITYLSQWVSVEVTPDMVERIETPHHAGEMNLRRN